MPRRRCRLFFKQREAARQRRAVAPRLRFDWRRPNERGKLHAVEAAGERHQRTGREGLELAKLWLESTTRFDVPWTSWGKGATLEYVTVPQIHGSAESFDLAGNHLEEDMSAR